MSALENLAKSFETQAYIQREIRSRPQPDVVKGCDKAIKVVEKWERGVDCSGDALEKYLPKDGKKGIELALSETEEKEYKSMKSTFRPIWCYLDEVKARMMDDSREAVQANEGTIKVIEKWKDGRG